MDKFETRNRKTGSDRHQHQHHVQDRNSNTRDIMKVPVERLTSRGKKPRVRRNKSEAEKKERRRKEERRYLTIGYPGEVRSPLKERPKRTPGTRFSRHSLQVEDGGSEE